MRIAPAPRQIATAEFFLPSDERRRDVDGGRSGADGRLFHGGRDASRKLVESHELFGDGRMDGDGFVESALC